MIHDKNQMQRFLEDIGHEAISAPVESGEHGLLLGVSMLLGEAIQSEANGNAYRFRKSILLIAAMCVHLDQTLKVDHDAQQPVSESLNDAIDVQIAAAEKDAKMQSELAQMRADIAAGMVPKDDAHGFSLLFYARRLPANADADRSVILSTIPPHSADADKWIKIRAATFGDAKSIAENIL